MGDRLTRFLQEDVTEEGEDSGSPIKAKKSRGAVFQPAWGVRGINSIMGNNKLAKDWSLHSIPPVDYKDFILAKDLETGTSF